MAGELHLCPLKAIVQLRPSLQHLDQAAAGRKRSAAAEASTDGDTTESEGEEAKPVTVKFARRDAGLNRCVPLAHRNEDIALLSAGMLVFHGVNILADMQMRKVGSKWTLGPSPPHKLMMRGDCCLPQMTAFLPILGRNISPEKLEV